jgi:hypothetical protein
MPSSPRFLLHQQSSKGTLKRNPHIRLALIGVSTRAPAGCRQKPAITPDISYTNKFYGAGVAVTTRRFGRSVKPGDEGGILPGPDHHPLGRPGNLSARPNGIHQRSGGGGNRLHRRRTRGIFLRKYCAVVIDRPESTGLDAGLRQPRLPFPPTTGIIASVCRPRYWNLGVHGRRAEVIYQITVQVLLEVAEGYRYEWATGLSLTKVAPQPPYSG